MAGRRPSKKDAVTTAAPTTKKAVAAAAVAAAAAKKAEHDKGAFISIGGLIFTDILVSYPCPRRLDEGATSCV